MRATVIAMRVYSRLFRHPRCWGGRGTLSSLGCAKYNRPSGLKERKRLGVLYQVRSRVTVTRLRLVEHPDSTEGRERERERDRARELEWTRSISEAQEAASTDTTVQDIRSPLERCRRPPNKAFSVSDLISPAWCELQYWYTLTKYGRKKRTPAMKLGSAVHKALEDELYMTVPVEITNKEDAWGLRIWNVIQGLRTLRHCGMTREMEIWGLVDGELVNGVIDQLSYECPNPELEATAAAYYAEIEAERAAVPEYQMSLSDYLLSPAQGGRTLSDLAISNVDDVPHEPDSSARQLLPPEVFSDIPRIYLTDIKTRGSRSMPTVKSSAFRPTLLQLQIYYHMLNRLITSDDVNIELLASRYGFDPQRPFTDAFISEVSSLNDQFFDSSSSREFDPDYIPMPEDAKSIPSSFHDFTPSSSQDSTGLLLKYNSLSHLWKLMKHQLRLTFLPSSSESSMPATDVAVAPSIPAECQPTTLESYPTSLSPLLTARFILSTPPPDTEEGTSANATNKTRVLGSRSFLFDPATMTSYLSDQMDWWRGHRDPRGVEVMDAWKCRICEFNELCEWRREKEWSLASRARRGGSSSASTAI